MKTSKVWTHVAWSEAWARLRPGTLLVAAALLAAVMFQACGKKVADGFEEGRARFDEAKFSEALPLFEHAAQSRRDDPAAYAWLAETYRRLGRKSEAVTAAEQALALDQCNSFALVVIADAVNPMLGKWEGSDPERTWRSLNEAVRCDSTDGNAWLGIWGEALHRLDVPMMRRAEGKLIETGFLSDAVLAFSRWTMRALPENAILITNGDMDTYPTYVIQKVQSFRPDVAIINRSLLSTLSYQRYVRDHEGVPMPFDDAALERLAPERDEQGNVRMPSDQIFQRWTDQARGGQFRRPIAIAATVDESFLQNYKANLVPSGGFLLYAVKPGQAGSGIDAMRRSLVGVKAADFAGPWTVERDRSPIRRMTTKSLVHTVTATALTLGEAAADQKNWDQARAMAEFAAEIERTSEAGTNFPDRLAALNKRITP